MNEVAIIALIGISIASIIQSIAGNKVGTDHAGHNFLVRQILSSGRKLLHTIPGLLNRSSCGALPLYFHWLLSFLPAHWLGYIGFFLNPVVNILLAAIIWAATWQSAVYRAESGLVAWVIVIFCLTPQFFHALSARNFGLSSRGIGLVLLSAFFLSIGCADKMGWESAWMISSIAAYLIFGFNTFAMQAMLILSLLMAALFGRWIPLMGCISGLGLFLIVHFRYSSEYLKSTVRFWVAFRRHLAPGSILAHRFSIWRDLLWDIWLKTLRHPRNGLRYAYGNSALIIVILNPLLVVAVSMRLAEGAPADPLVAYASEIAVCGAICAVLTSFRPTRFLGEPERYVEAVTPWSTIAGVGWLLTTGGTSALAATSGLFLVFDLVQFGLFYILLRYLATKPVDVRQVAQVVDDQALNDVRFCSNNEQITKLFLHNNWNFAYCITVADPYCNMTISDAFEPFPFLAKHALERIVVAYRINICVLDRNRYDHIFEKLPDGLIGKREIYRSPGLLVIRLDWSDTAIARLDTPPIS